MLFLTKQFVNIIAMKQPEVFRKIGAIIQELNDQYEYLQTTAENLNDLELELFVANTHFLKDHAEILRKLNLIKSQKQLTLPEYAGQKLADEEKPAEPKYFEPVVQPAKPTAARTPAKPAPKPEKQDAIQFELAPADEPAPQIDLTSDTPADSYSFEREEPETIRHELVIDETEIGEDEEENPVQVEAKAEPEPEPVEEVKPQPEEKPAKQAKAPETDIPLLTLYADEPKAEPAKKDELAKKEEHVLTLNEKMSAQLKDKGTEVVEPPITDIKAAISLNDKLLFVKDLFNGYSLAYSEAIEIVNRFTKFEEADRFLKTNYVTKNNWADKKATADKFYALLKRRYA